MVRQAHHERNQYITVRGEPVEGLNQNFLNVIYCLNLIFHVVLLRDCLFLSKRVFVSPLRLGVFQRYIWFWYRLHWVMVGFYVVGW